MSPIMAKWFSARVLLAGFILLLATLLVVLVVGNLSKRSNDTILDIVQQDSDLAMRTINYTETQDGQRRWSIQADSAAHDIKKKVATIENVRMVVYEQNGGDIVITAKQGTFDLEGGLVTLQGDVHLSNINGQSVFTEELVFENRTKLLHGEKRVRVVASDMHLSGIGLRYDLDRKVFKLLSSVEASFVDSSVKLP